MNTTPDHQKTSQQAWAILLTAFGLFCLLLGFAGYFAWHYRTHSMMSQGSLLLIRAPAEWVTWQRKGHTIFEQARNEQELEAGDRVRVAQAAGYGQVATLRLFDHSTLDMWARADIQLETLATSQWNSRHQTVVLRQYDGYVRYDLRNDQPYQQVAFQVWAGDSQIELTPGGSYSIDITHPERNMLMPEQESFTPAIIDIAVRSGSARVRKRERVVPLAAGEHVVIDLSGTLSEPAPALWQLVHDGTFSAYTEEEYNNTTITDLPTLPRARSWQVRSGPEGTEPSGLFRISHGCRPPQTDNDCPPDEKRRAAWFIRNGNQSTNFYTGVLQQPGYHRAGVDISEYRSLVFSAWVRILYQSVGEAGELGTECPIMVRFITKEKSLTDPDEERFICVYTSDDPAREPYRAPGVAYYRARQYEWYYLEIELRDPEWFPQTHYLRSIYIYANGHDYDSRVTEVSLIGSHYSPDARHPSDHPLVVPPTPPSE